MQDEKEKTAKITYTKQGYEAVACVWRKKKFAKKSPKTKAKLSTSGWYFVDDAGDDVWLAWLCPIMVEDGREVYPAKTEPCTKKEIKDLDEARNRRAGTHLDQEYYDKIEEKRRQECLKRQQRAQELFKRLNQTTQN